MSVVPGDLDDAVRALEHDDTMVVGDLGDLIVRELVVVVACDVLEARDHASVEVQDTEPTTAVFVAGFFVRTAVERQFPEVAVQDRVELARSFPTDDAQAPQLAAAPLVARTEAIGHAVLDAFGDARLVRFVRDLDVVLVAFGGAVVGRDVVGGVPCVLATVLLGLVRSVCENLGCCIVVLAVDVFDVFTFDTGLGEVVLVGLGVLDGLLSLMPADLVKFALLCFRQCHRPLLQSPVMPALSLSRS